MKKKIRLIAFSNKFLSLPFIILLIAGLITGYLAYINSQLEAKTRQLNRQIVDFEDRIEDLSKRPLSDIEKKKVEDEKRLKYFIKDIWSLLPASEQIVDKGKILYVIPTGRRWIIVTDDDNNYVLDSNKIIKLDIDSNLHCKIDKTVALSQRGIIKKENELTRIAVSGPCNGYGYSTFTALFNYETLEKIPLRDPTNLLDHFSFTKNAVFKTGEADGELITDIPDYFTDIMVIKYHDYTHAVFSLENGLLLDTLDLNYQ